MSKVRKSFTQAVWKLMWQAARSRGVSAVKTNNPMMPLVYMGKTDQQVSTLKAMAEHISSMADAYARVQEPKLRGADALLGVSEFNRVSADMLRGTGKSIQSLGAMAFHVLWMTNPRRKQGRTLP